ncbi:hypothetical protein K1719_030812 [Acacia pycnantha]|nr:hypothetical protein K1719_030812 [Acacia pycnantha]
MDAVEVRPPWAAEVSMAIGRGFESETAAEKKEDELLRPKSVSFFAWTGDGQTTFHSHSDISEVVFNYNHPAVVDFRLKLNISSWMGPP